MQIYYFERVICALLMWPPFFGLKSGNFSVCSCQLQDLFQTQNHSDQIQGVFKQQQFVTISHSYLQTIGCLRFEQSICQSFCHLLNTHIVSALHRQLPWSRYSTCGLSFTIKQSLVVQQPKTSSSLAWLKGTMGATSEGHLTCSSRWDPHIGGQFTAKTHRLL